MCIVKKHIENVSQYGIPCVVCINRFKTDTQAELDLAKKIAKEFGAFEVAIAEHWAKGGEGAIELATHVREACKTTKENNKFKFLYELDLSIEEKLRAVARSYGAEDIEISEEAKV